jgi:hypothetical protein
MSKINTKEAKKARRAIREVRKAGVKIPNAGLEIHKKIKNNLKYLIEKGLVNV